MYSPKGSGVYTPPRGTRSTRSAGSAPGRLTASTSKAKHQADRLELSEDQSDQLVSDMEASTAATTTARESIRVKILRGKVSLLRDEKSTLVLEIQDGTERFSKLEGAVAASEGADDKTYTEVLKEQLKQQKSYLHNKEMRLNLVNFQIGALSAQMLGEGIVVPEEKEFVNFGTMKLDEAQATFGGSSFASDIQTYVYEVMAATNQSENAVLSNILLKLKDGNLHKNNEFVKMFDEFTDDVKAVLGRQHRRTGHVWFTPAIRSTKEKLGFETSTKSMLWRITMYLDLDWDLGDEFVPENLRNPFPEEDETFHF